MLTTGTASAAATAVRRGLRHLRWYVREVLGENDYDKYVAHLARRHPGATPMSRRAFERDRTDHRERNPAARCC